VLDDSKYKKIGDFVWWFQLVNIWFTRIIEQL
jgi:hypothetical protein